MEMDRRWCSYFIVMLMGWRASPLLCLGIEYLREQNQVH